MESSRGHEDAGDQECDGDVSSVMEELLETTESC
jgi:hypothetical protein